jgi:hypothetical protein
MSFWSKLFPCRGCEAREAELDRASVRLAWFERQLDMQNRRLIEIADPRSNERLVQADRLDKRPIIAGPRADPNAGSIRLPGTEPPPPTDWEVDAEGA